MDKTAKLLILLFTFIITVVPVASNADSYTAEHAYSEKIIYDSLSANLSVRKVQKNAGKKSKPKTPPVTLTGIYAGTLVLKSTKTFAGSCTPTQSFPAAVNVTPKGKKFAGQLGNTPIAFSGGKTKKGFNLKGNFIQGTIKRKYKIDFTKVKSTSANILFTEEISVGKQKACKFVHKATFGRL